MRSTRINIAYCLMVLPFLALAGRAGAQNQKVSPFKSEQGVVCSPIETQSFFPQIDESFEYHPVRPENPLIRDGRYIANKLAVGSLMSKARGNRSMLFPAIDATGWVPPDCDLAVGPNHIVATVNASIAFFNKAGTKQFQQVATTFFNGLGAGSFQFDPKCFYDRVSGRYVILYDEEDDATTTSKILIAVSDDNDPNGTWFRYRFEAKLTVGANSYWLDYPGFGYNKDAYIACGNMFGFTSGSAGIQFIVIPKAPLLTGSPGTSFSLRDASSFSAQIAEMISATSPFCYAACRSGSTGMKVYAFQNLTTTPTFTSTSVSVPSNTVPSRAAQSTNSKTLDSLDGRYFNVLWRDGKLVAAHNIMNGTVIASRWYEVNTNNWPTSGSISLAQSGNVSLANQDCHMVAVCKNWQGDISTIFTRSSTSITADIMFAGRNAFDAVGGMGVPTLLESSIGNNYGSGRWGDYFGVDVDPADDNTFWGIGMNVNASNGWKTSIFSWTITPPLDLSAVSVSPGMVVGGNSVTGTVTMNHVAPPNTATVNLLSSNPLIAAVPGTATVASGSTTGNFNITTTAVTAITSVTITATYGTTSTMTTLIVNPVSLQLLVNPGFENGAVGSPWVGTGQTSFDSNAAFPPHGGGWKALMGNQGSVHSDTLYQDVTIPASAASANFKFWLRIDSTEASQRNGPRSAYDWLFVRILDTSGNILKSLVSKTNNDSTSSYSQYTFDVSEFKGQTIRVFFQCDENAQIPTRFSIDDLELNAVF